MYRFNKHSILRILSRMVVCYSVLTLIATSVFLPAPSHAQTQLILPAPGAMVQVTPPFSPTTIKGLKFFPDNPFRFDFIIDPGESNLTGDELKEESTKLIKYFLASLTVPEREMWVNLSPYEKDRIIPENFGRTEMGRDLLVQDYFLKQLTASLMYPKEDLGEEFWKKVYQMAAERYGTTDIPINTFNKIWIVPERAKVFVHDNMVFVEDYHLKVMFEQDYLALEVNKSHSEHGLGNVTSDTLVSSQDVSIPIIREILIPQIEKEVNEGKTFAPLRQIFHSMILATWYKQNLRKSFLGKSYVDQNKTFGLENENGSGNQQVYMQYLKAFEKGVFDFIKEDYDPATQEIIPRKYFSGGVDAATLSSVVDAASSSIEENPASRIRQIFRKERSDSSDNAMLSKVLNKSTVGAFLVGAVLTGGTILFLQPEVREKVFWDSEVEGVIKAPEYWYDEINFNFWYPGERRELFSVGQAIIDEINADINGLLTNFAFTPTGEATLLMPEDAYRSKLSDFYEKQVSYAKRVQDQMLEHNQKNPDAADRWNIPEQFQSWRFDYSTTDIKEMEDEGRIRIVSQAIQFLSYYFSEYGHHYNMIIGHRVGNNIPIPYAYLRPRTSYQNESEGEAVTFLPGQTQTIQYEYYELGASVIKTPPEYSKYFPKMEPSHSAFMGDKKFLGRADRIDGYVDNDLEYYQNVLKWYPELFTWTEIDLSLNEDGAPIKLAREMAFIQFLRRNQVSQLPYTELRGLLRGIVVTHGNADEKVHMYDGQQATLPYDINQPTRYDKNMAETRSTVGKVLLTRQQVHYRLNIQIDNYEGYHNNGTYEREHGEDTVFTVNRLGYWLWKNPNLRQRLGKALEKVDIESLDDVKEFLALPGNIQREILLQLPILSEEELIGLYENVWSELQTPDNPIKDGYDLNTADSFFLTKAEQAEKDNAMVSEEVGGIDLNPQIMNLEVDGQDLRFILPQQPLPNVQIQGLTPIIINITPITNIPALLGQIEEQNGEQLALSLN